jgi:hypothetical protein
MDDMPKGTLFENESEYINKEADDHGEANA